MAKKDDFFEKNDYAKDLDNQFADALDIMVVKGEVLAICPKCTIYLSFDEREKCKCDSCESSFNEDEILYGMNKSFGQNN